MNNNNMNKKTIFLAILSFYLIHIQTRPYISQYMQWNNCICITNTQSLLDGIFIFCVCVKYQAASLELTAVIYFVRLLIILF